MGRCTVGCAISVVLLGTSGCWVRDPLVYPRSAEVPDAGETEGALSMAHTEATATSPGQSDNGAAVYDSWSDQLLGVVFSPALDASVGLGGGCALGGELGTRIGGEGRCRLVNGSKSSPRLTASLASGLQIGLPSGGPFARGGFDLSLDLKDAVAVTGLYAAYVDNWYQLSSDSFDPFDGGDDAYIANRREGQLLVPFGFAFEGQSIDATFGLVLGLVLYHDEPRWSSFPELDPPTSFDATHSVSTVLRVVFH